MLVLSRKVGEEIVVPECGLIFTILEVRGDRIRLGISAPPEIHVYRREVWERIRSERGPGGESSQPAEDAQLPGRTARNGASRPA